MAVLITEKKLFYVCVIFTMNRRGKYIKNMNFNQIFLCFFKGDMKIVKSPQKCKKLNKVLIHEILLRHS